MIRILAGLSAALAIGAGAFGAHLASGQAEEWLRTGALYQMVHAVAALVILERAKGAAGTLLAGSFIFAVTLYLMALGLPRWLGAITPIGGIAMISGWLWFVWSVRSGRHTERSLSRNAATSAVETVRST